MVSHRSGEDHQLISKNGSAAETQKVLPSQWSETTDGVVYVVHAGLRTEMDGDGERE